MPRISATHQVERLLSIVPWIRGLDYDPTVAEVCARFEITADELERDLSVLSFVGVPPYSPDVLVDAFLDEEFVVIRGDYFDQPLRLSEQEALALVAAGVAAAAEPGYDPAGPLARGVAKVAGVLGVELADDLSVSLGAVTDDVIGPLRAAIAANHTVALSYYSHARHETTERVVEPIRVFSAEGAWYLVAWCRLADDERQFRLDRVLGLAVNDEAFEPRTAGDRGAFVRDESIPRVTLDLAPSARWVAERYPVDSVTPLPDGGQRVVLAVAARPWLERLLLRLGSEGHVVGGEPADQAAGRSAACRLLERYGS